jgi:hypothetical protein
MHAKEAYSAGAPLFGSGAAPFQCSTSSELSCSSSESGSTHGIRDDPAAGAGDCAPRGLGRGQLLREAGPGTAGRRPGVGEGVLGTRGLRSMGLVAGTAGVLLRAGVSTSMGTGEGPRSAFTCDAGDAAARS